MARGKPLTPEQIETASEVFARTGNYSEAGRAIGVGPNVARDAILRHENASRRKLHAIACEEGLRKGREFLSQRAEQIDTVLTTNQLEPTDMAALIRASCQVQTAIAQTAQHDFKRKIARLTRERTREEIALIKIRKVVMTDFDKILSMATDEEKDALRAIADKILAREPRSDGGTSEG